MKKDEADLLQTRCPYCREELKQDARAIVRCSCCFTRSHADCFDECETCSVYGCKGIPTHTPVELVHALRIRPACDENFRPNLWPPIWIILYTICLCAYLAAG